MNDALGSVARRIRAGEVKTTGMARAPNRQTDDMRRRLEMERKRQEAMVKSAERELDAMQRAAEAGNVDMIENRGDRLKEQIKDKDFPRDRAKEFLDRVTVIRRDGYQKRVDDILSEAMTAARLGDNERKNELLAEGRKSFSVVVRLGPDEEFKIGVQKKLEIIRMTTGQGTDEKAKKRAEEEAARQRDRGQIPPEAEMRRAIRYIDPQFQVTIGDNTYQTVDWSIRGMLITGYEGSLRVGDRVRLSVSFPDVDGGGRIVGHVVRRDEPPNSVAVDFGEISTVMLWLVKALKDEGITPTPEY